MTVLFSDVISSTALGERLDPESLRRVIVRYFGTMKAVIERHGGTVEKFAGDAVMAVFGVPVLHEDDALRAVRAACEMREALADLNEELARDYDTRLEMRIGVNTGEVVTGTEERLVTGDAINVGARLEQTAEPGEILIGEVTYRMVRDSVSAESVAPLTIKGKSDPVAAWKLVEVSASTRRSARLDSLLIGRDRELALLQEAFRRTVDVRACELLTVLGAAGVGKSRLTSEFLPRLRSGTRVVRGRCLPYGEGITFWPIVEVLRDAAGIGDLAPEEARAMLLELLEPSTDSTSVGERLAALLGLADVTPGVQETFWAVRKLMEVLAGRQPLVVVFDDIHWAESTFLDLLEYLVDCIHDVPVLLLCLARPELLEIRGTWMTGKTNASLVTLRPLTEVETEGLIQNLLGGAQLTGQARARIAEAAEGNPLFVEETLRMLVDDGLLQPRNGSWIATGDLLATTIPPTIQALLGARLDRLDEEERAVIERASVIGRVFTWGAVSEISPENQRARVGSHLQSLMRKELIRRDQSGTSEEDAFRFAHILIGDAAYRRIPKAARAELHERFAAWVEAKSRGRAGEYEEIVGYHLEQAYRSLAELGPANERVESLGRRGATPLASAGRRAFARGDMPAAVNLLSRAASLLPGGDPARLELLPELAFSRLETGDLAGVQEVVAETSDVATASGDRRLQAQALILGLWARLFTDPEGWAEEAHREATRAISMFEDQADERGLAKAWSVLGLFHLTKCEFGASEQAWEKAAAHAEAAGDRRDRLESLSWVPLCVWGGPTPVEEAIRRCETVLERAAGDRKAMSTALFTRAKLEAMRGRFDEARELIARARSMLEDVALTVWTAGPLTQMAAWVELLAGDAAAAERDLRWGVETLTEIGELAWLPTVAGILAEAIYAQSRHNEAEEFLRVSEDTAGSDDAYSQVLLRGVRSKILARRGEADDAARLARGVVAIARTTDSLFIQAFALTSLGEVLYVVGRSEEAESVLVSAIDICKQKGYLVGEQRARELLEAAARLHA